MQNLHGEIKRYNLAKKTTLTQFDVLPYDVQKMKLLWLAEQSSSMGDLARTLGWKPKSLALRGIKLGIWQQINEIFRAKLAQAPAPKPQLPTMGGRYPLIKK